MKTIKILYFGMISEMAQTSDETIEYTENMNVSALRTQLENRYPKLKTMSYKVAINQQLTNEDATIGPNDEIALLPPFAGG